MRRVRGTLCPCRTLLISLSTAATRLSLSHATVLLVYRGNMAVLVARCCSSCPPRLYDCPCRTLMLSLTNDARQGKQQCAWRKTFDLLKKKFNLLHTRFQNTHRMNLILRMHIKKFTSYSSQLGFFVLMRTVTKLTWWRHLAVTQWY